MVVPHTTDFMATYIYETIPSKPGEYPEYFEVQQEAGDSPLTEHPVSGVPIRRVSLGGPAIVNGLRFDPGTAEGAGCCGE